MRRKFVVAALLFLAAFGCNRFAGPLAVRQMGRVEGPTPDGGRYTIPEQEQRGRERLTVLEDDIRIGPKAYADRPSPTGR
jgi:hypothetical protein